MLNNIKIYNYRNINKLDLDLQKGNLIIAQNGYGKTNLLESIYYPVFRNSFRPTSSYEEIVGTDDVYTKAVLDWNVNNLEMIISSNNTKRRQIKLNSKNSQTKKIISKFPLILFAPHSIDLTNGDPKTRRDDLDFYLSTVTPSYYDLLSSYRKVLKNRNAVIRAIAERMSEPKELAYWTEKIAKLSFEIYTYRNQFFEDIKPYITNTSREIYHDIEEFNVHYVPNFSIEGEDAYTQILNKYLENEEKELMVGKTLYGVHKDDYEFRFKHLSVGNKNLKYHGSRGQQRIGSFIFKIAQFKMLRESNDEEILLLLDDIMSELDEKHRNNIANYIVDLGEQFIITGANLEEIPKVLIQNSQQIKY